MQEEFLCSSCGQSLPSVLSAEVHPSLHEEIAYINQETKRLEEQILLLNAKKAALLHRLNSLTSSTKDIPPETLSIIFEHTCAPRLGRKGLGHENAYIPDRVVEKRFPAVCLGAVCSEWRRVAWSTPELWTSVVLDITLNRTKTAAMLLQLYLDNIGNLPLSLNLRHLESNMDGPHAWNADNVTALLQPVLNILLSGDNMDRLGALRLGGELSHWVGYITNQYPRLRALSLDHMRVYDSLVEVSNIPSLRQFSLYKYQGLIITFVATENITVLDFTFTSMHLCVHILLQCPNVTECHCRMPDSSKTYSMDSLGGLARPEFIFPHLKILSWTLNGYNWNEMFLSRLRIPAIRRLDFHKHFVRTSPLDKRTAANFFSRLPSTLVTIGFHDGFEGWNQVDIIQYLYSLTHVRSLTLRRCPPAFVQHVVQALTPDSEAAVNGMGLMPHLNEMLIQRHSWGVVDDLVTLLSRRTDWRGAQVFQLKIDKLGEGAEHFRERLEKAAQRDGYLVEYSDPYKGVEAD